MGQCQLQAGPLGLPLPFSGCPAAASRQRPPWGCWGVPTLPCLPALGLGRVCQCHLQAPHPSRGRALATSHCHQPPSTASSSPIPLWGPGPLVPLPHVSPALVPGLSPAHCPAWLFRGWSGALVPVLGAQQCQQPLGLAVLGLAQPSVTPQDSCAGSPHAKWHPLCWLGLLALPWPRASLGMPEREGHMEPPGDTLRAPHCCSPGPGVCPVPAPHSLCLLPMPCSPCPVPVPHSLLPIPCSPCPAPHSLFPIPCSPCPAPHSLLPVPVPHVLLPMPPLPPALAGGHRSCGAGAAGLVGTMVRSLQRVEGCGSPVG